MAYVEKFKEFIEMCEDVKRDGIDSVVVAAPWVIGDDYLEMSESLNRLAGAGLALHIVKPNKGWTP